MLSEVLPIHRVKDRIGPVLCCLDVLTSRIGILMEADVVIKVASQSDAVDADTDFRLCKVGCFLLRLGENGVISIPGC